MATETGAVESAESFAEMIVVACSGKPLAECQLDYAEAVQRIRQRDAAVRHQAFAEIFEPLDQIIRSLVWSRDRHVPTADVLAALDRVKALLAQEKADG